MGRFDYPTVARERVRTNPNAESWEGLCHGWAAAAINFLEPKAAILESPNGIRVPFGSSDIKALLDYYQGTVSYTPLRMMGSRCELRPENENPSNGANAPECRDVNAGAFQVVLANQIGLQKVSFVADVSRDFQVWNQPVFGYQSKIVRYQEPSVGAALGTVKEVVLRTTMHYTSESGTYWEAINNTDEWAESSRDYLYRVELDRDGSVVGGEWMSWDRPDFLWTQPKPRFLGYYSGIEGIYNAAMSSTTEVLRP